MLHRALKCLFPLSLALILPLDSRAQVLQSSTVQHLTAATGADAKGVSAGGMVQLWVDVTPKPKIHVYAQGAKGFTPVALVVSKIAGVTAGKPKYPPSERFASPGTDGPVPVYAKPFRIVQPIAVGRKTRSGQVLNIAGTLTYESCDDRICYPAASIPVVWTVKVR